MKKDIMEKLREKLASIEHTRWADWQKYLHSKLIVHKSGLIELPEKSYRHWERQIKTDYKDLSEKEKDSDRLEVDKYLPLIKQFLSDTIDEQAEKILNKLDNFRSIGEVSGNAYKEIEKIIKNI